MSNLPTIIYGTAWKEERTAGLVKSAVTTGFRAIDTANQKKHYREDFTGEALLELKEIKREDLFLQSKYTYVDGQDHRLPYDPKASFTEQVNSSFAGTLQNLHTDYLDSYLIHGPSSYEGFSKSDWEVWGAMEKLVEAKKIRMIGVSNVGIHHLHELYQKAKIKPSVVQNRCYAARGWDEQVREFCLTNKIIYEGFSLLTANPHVVMSEKVNQIATRLQKTPAQIALRFAIQIGILPLTGTTNPQHMEQDLDILNFKLTDEDVSAIRAVTR